MTNTLTCEKTLNKLIKFCKDNTERYYRASFAIATENEGKIKVTEFINRPCWGELRCHYDDIHKPHDLTKPFPEGIPVAVAIAKSQAMSATPEETLKYLFGPFSPWVSAFGSEGMYFVESPEGKQEGWILTDTKINPTTLLHLLISLNNNQFTNHFQQITWYKDFPLQYQYLLKYYWTNSLTPDKRSFDKNKIKFFIPSDTYIRCRKMNWERFLKGDPEEMANESGEKGTLYDRIAYNRRDIHRLWVGNDTPASMCPNFDEEKEYTPEELVDLFLPIMQSLDPYHKDNECAD